MADPADPLFEVPLEDFVSERAALAKRLRAGGDREASDAVKAAKKPSAAAWAANQLARAGELGALLDAAAALRDAQEAALSGGGAGTLREAAAAEREAVEAAVAAGRRTRPGGKPFPAAGVERLRAILQGAARDPGFADVLAAGRVVVEPPAGGAWGLVGADAGSAKPPSESRSATPRKGANAAVKEGAKPPGGSGRGAGATPRTGAGRAKPRVGAGRGAGATPPSEADAAAAGAAARKAEQERRRELRAAQEERTRHRRAAERAAQRCSDAGDKVERARRALDAALDAADEAQAAFDTARAQAAEAEARVTELER
jgi:hypothetical protein